MRRPAHVVMACVAIFAAVAPFANTQAPKVPEPPLTFTTLRAWRPDPAMPTGGHMVYFMDRAKMKGKDFGTIHFKPAAGRAAAQLPIDWVKNFSFPMYLNDTYGDCYYAAGCHADNLFTANASTKSEFSLAAIKTRYFALSGGDNGLADQDMQGEMLNRYLADVQAAKIVSWANLDPTSVAATQTAIQQYGCVMFTFSVASAWINNSGTGAIWDASTFRANNNGHAVVLGGCDERGYYKLLTWGTYVYLTPAGLRVCDPGAWVAFSTRWFNSSGYAPNGQHITALASSWQSDTGKAIPASVINAFPPAGPVVGNPVITSPTTANGTTGVPFSYAITATNSPTTFNATGLPTGLALGASGVISGTPQVAGVSLIALTARNASGVGSSPLTLTVSDTPIPPTGADTVTFTIKGVTSTYELVAPGTTQKIRELAAPLGPVSP